MLWTEGKRITTFGSAGKECGPGGVTIYCVSVQSPNGKWNKFGGRLAWDESAICCNNPAFGGTGNAKTGEDYVAAPNVDHTQVRLILLL